VGVVESKETKGGKMKLIYLTLFISELSAAIDTGKYQDVSIEEVEEHIANGDLFPYLRRRLKGDVDLSLFKPEIATRINADLLSLLEGYAGQERRKWGISNNGLCLLVSWTAELIRHSFGDQEYESLSGSD